MTAAAFNDALLDLSGLTKPMMDALRSLAEKLTEAQRDRALKDLQHANDDILAAFEEHKADAAETEHEVNQMSHALARAEEKAEQAGDIAAAASAIG